MVTYNWDTQVGDLWGVGEAYVKKLAKLNIFTVRDLLYHRPNRYEDWSMVSKIVDLQQGERVTIRGQLTDFVPLRTKNGKYIQKAMITDTTGAIQVIWFNQQYLVRVLKRGDWFSLSGKVDMFGNALSLVSPEFEKLKIDAVSSQPKIDNSTIHTGRLVPIYPETYGLSSKWLRSRIWYLLEQFLPVKDELGEAYAHMDSKSVNSLKTELLDLSTALKQVHFPDTLEKADIARQRLAIDELVELHLKNLFLRSTWKKLKVANRIVDGQSAVNKFKKNLPFELTNAQKKAIEEIIKDMEMNKPMNRLLEGDVGSGKTAVAMAAAVAAVNQGLQVAIMAPTEILAEQHFMSFSKILNKMNIKIVLQTGRKKFVKPGKDMEFDIIIGTHALLTDVVNFDRLGLVVIDEQHRFGVKQRAKLINKSTAPHVLTMTATPIPRTVALTMYGDLDLSVLDEMPLGRKKVKTWLVPSAKREKAYEWIKKELLRQPETSSIQQAKNKQNFKSAQNDKTNLQNISTDSSTRSQVFVVCPFIEPSESMSTVKAAKEVFGSLQKVFKNFKLDLLHGKLKGKEKDEVIEKFRSGKTDILVSTPVVEVGVDIPNATIMLIETAERFGLAQLHQLRGRVGRAGQQAYCLLFTESAASATQKRLLAMESIYSGLKLAELDMKLRGPGQIYGTSQHGFVDLKFADYADVEMIKSTREIGSTLFRRLDEYPDLSFQLKQRTIRDVEPN